MKTCSLPDRYLAPRNRLYAQVRAGLLYTKLDEYGCEQFELTAKGLRYFEPKRSRGPRRPR